MENRFMELERGIRSILSGIAWEKVENEMKDIRGGTRFWFSFGKSLYWKRFLCSS